VASRIDEHLDRRYERRLLGVVGRRVLDDVLPAPVREVVHVEAHRQRVPLHGDVVGLGIDEPELESGEALVEQVPALVRDRRLEH
jgi:hypothetical protein